MKIETLNEMIDTYRYFEKISCELANPFLSNIVTSEEEFINNVKMIDLLYEGFWENKIKEEELIKSTKILDTVDFSGKVIENKKVYLKDIVGVTHCNYSFLPWIIALPILKRFYGNFPKTEEEKEKLFDKMKNNDFKEKLKLVKSNGEYYICEGHNRIIICKALGLEYLKADILLN